MVALLAKMKTTYDFIFYELADERSKDMFPDGWVLFILLPFYLYFSLSLGPRLMRDRAPFKLTNIMFYYNLFQIYICTHALVLGFRGGWLTTYNYACQPYDATDTPESRMVSPSGFTCDHRPFSRYVIPYPGLITFLVHVEHHSWHSFLRPSTIKSLGDGDIPFLSVKSYDSKNLLNAVWLYTQTKLIDLLDTVFFVLRKKDRQISFLHVFHHSIMPIASFIGLKYYPNGHGTFVGMVNAVVHIVMYTYYLISGLGPEYQKYLWWKKHLTSMQIVQFGMVAIHNLIALLDTSCTYPKWISSLLIINSLVFVYMFGKFYYVNYIQKSDEIQKPIKMSNGNGNHFEKKISNEKRKVLR